MRGNRRKLNIAASMVAGALAGTVLPSSARGDVTKANNTDPLNVGTSYVGGNPPVPADKINFDATITGPLTYSIGDNLSVNGLNFGTVGGIQTIDGVTGKKLTLGNGGIVSTAAHNLVINADLHLGASQSFFIPDTRTLTLNGAISSAAGVNLTVGGGTANTNAAVYLLNAASTYTGQTRIFSGTLRMGAPNVLPATTVVVVGGNGQTIFSLNGHSQTVAGLDVVNNNTRRIQNGTAGPAPVLTINVPAGTTWNYGSTVGNGAVANDNNLAITKIGGGLQELSNATNINHTGATTISGGALGFQLANGGTGSNFILDGGVFQNTVASTFTRAFGAGAGQLQMTANGGGFSAKNGLLTVNLGGAMTAVEWLAAPGAGFTGTLKFGHESSASEVLVQNPINLNGAIRTINVADNAGSAGDFTTLAGIIADGTGGAGGISKTGSGILVLSAPNTYTGPTNIAAGVLTAAAPGTVPTAGGINVANGAALAVRTTTFSSAQADALRAAATYDPAGGGFGYDVPTASTFTPANPISGALQLYKLGGGDLILSVANTHTLGTTVLAGRLLVGDPAGLGSGPLTLGGGSTIASTDGSPRSIAAPMTITGAVTFGSTTTETGSLTFTSAVNMNGAERNLTVRVPTTFAAGYTNGGINQKLGLETLTLQGTSTNTGAIEIREGTLVLAAGATLNATDGLRVMGTLANATARMEVRGTYNIATTTGNIRVGHENGNGTGVTNVLDIYGTLAVTSFTTGGGTQMGSDSVNATINLFPGSVLATKQIANSANDFAAGTTTSVNIDGGTLRAIESRTTYMTGLTGGAFVRAGGATIDTNGFDITIGQSLQHVAADPAIDGGLKKTGAGILALTGTANNYTGSTTVIAGTLQVNAANGTGTGAVAVNSGATLGGTGSIAGPITLDAGAKLAPGASAGTLTVGTLSLDAAVAATGTGALIFEIGSAFDQVNGTTITTGVGKLEIDDFAFSPLAGIGPGPYTLLTGVAPGSLGANTTASSVAGLDGYDAQLTQNGGNVILTLTGVPEPGTAGVVGVAAIGLLGRRRRRQWSS
jgi:fibronectin-binding autotransporter adhesin